MIPVEEKIQIVQRAIDISVEYIADNYPAYMCNTLANALEEHGYMSLGDLVQMRKYALLQKLLPEFYEIEHGCLFSPINSSAWEWAKLPEGIVRFDIYDGSDLKWNNRVKTLQYLKSIYENM